MQSNSNPIVDRLCELAGPKMAGAIIGDTIAHMARIGQIDTTTLILAMKSAGPAQKRFFDYLAVAVNHIERNPES